MTKLQLHPNCLMFFVDETGHEEFADPKYPVFGLGGCAIMAGAADKNLRQPWRLIKEQHFGSADVRLHASELRDPTHEQLDALAKFFRSQPFGRFAATMTAKTGLPIGKKAYDFMPNAVRNRWTELASRCHPDPVEVALIFEDSERGNYLVEKYFGTSVVHINRRQVKVHHGFMPKSSDEALEVADFVVQAAGRYARTRANGNQIVGKDFDVVFKTNPLWSSFIAITGVEEKSHEDFETCQE